MTEAAVPTRQPNSTRPTALVSTVESDSHTWNLVYLQLVLEELGHNVTNLGACVPDDLLVAEALRERPDLVALSSINGHGHHDGRRVIARLRAYPELDDTRIVIGGVLGTGGRSHADDLLAAGFDGVFDGTDAVGALRTFLAARPAVARC